MAQNSPSLPGFGRDQLGIVVQFKGYNERGNVRSQWEPDTRIRSLVLMGDARQQPPIAIVGQGEKAQGFMAAFASISARWNLKSADIPLFLGQSKDGKTQWSLTDLNLVPQTQDVVDRIAYLTAITFGLVSLFRTNIESELKWLNTSNPKLDNDTPLNHIRRGHMLNLIAVSNLVSRERGF